MDPDAATLLIRITKMDPDPHKKIKAKKMDRNSITIFIHFYRVP